MIGIEFELNVVEISNKELIVFENIDDVEDDDMVVGDDVIDEWIVDKDEDDWDDDFDNALVVWVDFVVDCVVFVDCVVVVVVNVVVDSGVDDTVLVSKMVCSNSPVAWLRKLY